MTTPNTPQTATEVPSMFSGFSYEPPEAPEAEDLNAVARDSIAEIEAEFADEEAKQWLDDEAAPDAEVEPEVEPEVEAEPDEDVDPKMAKGIERVIARELAAKEREKAAEAAEARAKATIEEAKSLGDIKGTKALREQANTSPLSVIKELGQDPTTFIRLAMAESLGDKAPDDLKEFAKNAAYNRRVADLEAKIEKQDRERVEMEYFNTIQAGARTFVTDAGISKKYPTLAKIASANPDRAHREVMEEIARDARERMGGDPTGQPLAYEEAAKRVEARANEWLQILGATPGQGLRTGTTTAAMQGKKPNVTPPPAKAPAKPLRPWEVKNDLQEQGLQEAMREFHRVEAAAKAKR